MKEFFKNKKVQLTLIGLASAGVATAIAVPLAIKDKKQITNKQPKVVAGQGQQNTPQAQANNVPPITGGTNNEEVKTQPQQNEVAQEINVNSVMTTNQVEMKVDEQVVVNVQPTIISTSTQLVISNPQVVIPTTNTQSTPTIITEYLIIEKEEVVKPEIKEQPIIAPEATTEQSIPSYIAYGGGVDMYSNRVEEIYVPAPETNAIPPIDTDKVEKDPIGIPAPTPTGGTQIPYAAPKNGEPQATPNRIPSNPLDLLEFLSKQVVSNPLDLNEFLNQQ